MIRLFLIFLEVHFPIFFMCYRQGFLVMQTTEANLRDLVSVWAGITQGFSSSCTACRGEQAGVGCSEAQGETDQ